MKRKQTSIENISGQSLIEDISLLDQLTLADDIVECQVCNEPFTDGDNVVAHLQSPPGSTGYSITQLRCLEHTENIASLLTLGVDEIIVQGCIRRCSNHSNHQSSQGLRVTAIRIVSSAATTTGRRITSQQTHQRNPSRSIRTERRNHAVQE